MSITSIATDRAYGDHGDPSLGVENVVPDNGISGGPPYPMDLSMRAQKEKKEGSSRVRFLARQY